MAKLYYGIHSVVINEQEPLPQPTVLLLGDSWFWYPFGNLAQFIAEAFPDETFLVLGRNGAEAQQWRTKYRTDIRFAIRNWGRDLKALILSGGGNDIAGPEDFDPIVREHCSAATSVGECYEAGQPDGILNLIAAAYRDVILKLREVSDAPVFCHNYENAWPSGKGLLGPADWLKLPMDQAAVPSPLRRPLFEDLLQGLHLAQLGLAADATLGRVIPIKTAGTLPDTESVWANELHLTYGGYREMVRKAWVGVLKPHLV